MKGSASGDPRSDHPTVTLSDEVVLLRPWSESDARSISDASKDPAIQRYSFPESSIEDTIASIEDCESKWRRFAATASRQVSRSRSSMRLQVSGAGWCGVDEWSSADVAQIGYGLAADARGRGFATRAVILMTRWLFELGAARVFLTVVSDNTPSAAVARRAGFVHGGILPTQKVWQGRRYDIDIFAALPDEWRNRVDQAMLQDQTC